VIWPNNDAVGIALGCAALAQMGLVFLNAILGLYREMYRNETEVAWMIASLVLMVAAGVTIGSGHNIEFWGWLSVALAIDTAALFVARYLFK
jgi:predicted branched-subunit amino acid permease